MPVPRWWETFSAGPPISRRANLESVRTLIGGLGIAIAVAIGVGFFAIFQARFHPDIPLDGGDRLVGLQNIYARTYRQEHRALHDFLVTTALVMSTVGLLAAFGPARRGLRIEPSEALKGE